MKYTILILACLLIATPTVADEKVDIPFYMPVLEGWRTETIALPPEFAPELVYDGVEEIRFAPGMMEEGEDDFWTYAFVWWLPAEVRLTADIIQADLTAYFHGLAVTVAESKDLRGVGFNTEVLIEQQTELGEMPARFVGKAQVFDAFASLRSVRLNYTVEIFECPEQERLAVFFKFSPQAMMHAVWQDLDEIRDGFACAQADASE